MCECAMSAQAHVLETLVSRLVIGNTALQFMILYERLWILWEVEAS